MPRAGGACCGFAAAIPSIPAVMTPREPAAAASYSHCLDRGELVLTGLGRDTIVSPSTTFLKIYS